jgi:hypothetical protein
MATPSVTIIFITVRIFKRHIKVVTLFLLKHKRDGGSKIHEYEFFSTLTLDELGEIYPF